MELKLRYVTDEQNQRVAVQLDIETFEKLERILEDYGLVKLMEENDDEVLDVEAARAYYDALEKAP
jgi:hypothetical protein